MRLFSYVVKHDSGFAPNPFGGFLTLATCKPSIRKSAKKGDYIVGTGSVSTVGKLKLVYAAKIAEVVPFKKYGVSPKYKIKRPSCSSEWWRQLGDNIYVEVKGKWKQRRNDQHDNSNKRHDLSGKNVLVCKRFWYFGSAKDCDDIPKEFRRIIKKGQGYKTKDGLLAQRFIDWLEDLPRGLQGTPQESSPPKLCC